MNPAPEQKAGFISVVPFSDEYTEQAIACARQMHQESLLHRNMDFDAGKVLQQFYAPVHNKDMYFKIAVLNGEMVAGFLGIVLTIFFGADRIGKDLAIFVKPEARLSRAAFLLVRDFEEWARSRGASHGILSQSTGINIDTTTRFYSLMGYSSMGVIGWKQFK